MQTSEESTSKKKKNGKGHAPAEPVFATNVAAEFVDEAPRVPRAPAEAMHVEIERVALGDNYRKSIDYNYIDSLAKTIARDGQLEPILVRPRPGLTYDVAMSGSEAGPDFEIVFGECRWRAIVHAELPTIWLYVRELSDLEVLELQLLENMKRKDPHPLDEAEAFEKLRTKHGYSVERIAAKIEKPVAYVYEILKLCDLSPASRDAFYAGRLNKTLAVSVARIPHAELQAKAIEAIAANEEDGREEMMGAREALWVLHDRFMLRLVDAPFDRKDKELVAAAGSCSDCPKRTGKQPELFADVAEISKDDLCTDPTCFAEKRAAHIANEKARLEAKGVTVVVSKSKSDNAYGPPKAPAGYVVAKNQVDRYSANERTFDDLTKTAKAKKVEVERAVLLTRDGKSIPLITTESAEALKKALGVKERPGYQAPKPVDPKVKAANDAAGKKAGSKIYESVLKTGVTDALLRILFSEHANSALTKELEKLRGARLIARYVQHELETDWQDGLLKKLCAEYGVDLKKLVAAELAAVKEGAPVRGVCSKCGCTEDEACPDGCVWVDNTETLCSTCAPAAAKPVKAKAASKAPKKKPAKKAKAKSTKKSAAKKK